MHNLNIRRPFPLWKARGKDEAWSLDKHGAPRVCPGLKARRRHNRERNNRCTALRLQLPGGLY